MEKSLKVYRYRLKPNYEQSLQLNDWMETCRWLYNKILDRYEKDYTIAKSNFYYYRNQYPYYFDNFINTNNIKIKIGSQFYEFGGRIRNQGKGEMSTYKHYVWLKSHSPQHIDLNELPAVVCQEVLERVENAYKKFFTGGGYPKYKKYGTMNSITWTQSPPFKNIKINDLYISLPKFGKIKMIYHRNIPENGIIKRVNIIKSNIGKYYINIFVETNSTLDRIKTYKICGIDRNIKLDDVYREFMVLYDGNKSIQYKMPTYLRNLNNKLKTLQIKTSKLQKGDIQWKKLMQQQRHVWDRINNCKKDWIEKTTLELSKNYDVIIVENLDIKSLTNKEKGKLKASKKKTKKAENQELTHEKQKRRGFSEVSHTMFLTRLKQKIGEDNVIEVDPAFTSMDCSKCGYRNFTLKLSDREWKCPSCNTIHIRDSNAAINIYNKGIELLKS